MQTINETPLIDADVASPGALHPFCAELKSLLENVYGVQFTILDGISGETLQAAAGQPTCDWTQRDAVFREVLRRGEPEFVDDEDPILTLAVPLVDSVGNGTVAVATFLTRPVSEVEDLFAAANVLGIEPYEARCWARSQRPWNADSIKRISDLVLDRMRTRDRVRALQAEADNLSLNLAETYEEISLLHRLTQNLKLSKSDEELGRLALDWLRGVVPAKAFAIQLLPVPNAEKTTDVSARRRTVLVTRGEGAIDVEQIAAMIDYFGANSRRAPVVANRSITEKQGWPCPQVRQMLAVALVEGENLFGWLLAINHVEDGDFGTVEANLLSSVATILGIHSGNIELYRQQSDFLAGIVRAFTSAIDAKDPYTCGHSDRVARVAVRLAEELGCDAKTVNTLYLAGLLHDVGKIGIDDSVLRKEGRLSDEEYEYIKRHVEIGHHILCDLVKLEDVLPAVLHHHESWDGHGYPDRIGDARIPFAARVIAVADSFDAMSSNRPYRQGLPAERVDHILREGAGKQWDPDVIDAFFRAHDDIYGLYQDQDK
jgi:hypothetical protein